MPLVLVVAATGCLPSEQEQVAVSFVGTVTENGAPLAGASLEISTPGEDGLPVVRGQTPSDANGDYALGSSIDELRCFMVAVEVEVLNPDGSVRLAGRRTADGCGENTADFDF